jgi:hypothetical protein
MPPSEIGITASVIQAMMPPPCISVDLVDATLATLPPPPPDASAAWRRARITQLIEEIVAYQPTNAAQSHMAAQIIMVRALADHLASQAQAPDLTVKQMCSISGDADRLTRTAEMLERSLRRLQKRQAKNPVPLPANPAAGLDLEALDAVWCRRPMPPSPNAKPPLVTGLRPAWAKALAAAPGTAAARIGVERGAPVLAVVAGSGTAAGQPTAPAPQGARPVPKLRLVHSTGEDVSGSVPAPPKR